MKQLTRNVQCNFDDCTSTGARITAKKKERVPDVSNASQNAKNPAHRKETSNETDCYARRVNKNTCPAGCRSRRRRRACRPPLCARISRIFCMPKRTSASFSPRCARTGNTIPGHETHQTPAAPLYPFCVPLHPFMFYTG